MKTDQALGNLQRFIEVSQPVVNKNEIAMQTCPTVAELFQAISKVAAFGLRFEFEEPTSENSEILVYVPQLSLLKIKFKPETNMQKVVFETPRDFYQDQSCSSFTPWEAIQNRIHPAQSSMLETASLHDVDCDRSYFAIKWNF